MKSSQILSACFATLLAACLAPAAETKTVNRVSSIVDVETDDPSGYALWIQKYNEVAKAKLGIEQYLRVYESRFDTREEVGRVRAVASAASVAELTKNAMALENDPAIAALMAHMKPLRKISGRTLYQTLRFEGANPKGSANYNSLINVTDEAAYLKTLDQLRAIYDAAGFKDAQLACSRVLAGRSNHTHRIVISLPSQERLAGLLDMMANNQRLHDWRAEVAKYRTVVATFTSREITK